MFNLRLQSWRLHWTRLSGRASGCCSSGSSWRFLFFHLYAHNVVEVEGRSTHQPLWLGLFLLSLIGLAVLVSVVWYWRLDDRRLDYRALSEALRVRYFWGLAGLTKSVAENYMGQLEGEMSWARRALYAVAQPPRFWKRIYDSRTPFEQEECLRAVADRWVRDQREYYNQRHRHAHNCSAALRVVGLILALAGWGMSFWLLVGGWLLRREPRPVDRGIAATAVSTALTPPDAGVRAVEDRRGTSATKSGRGTAERDDLLAGPDARYPHHLVLIFSSLLVIGGGLMIAYCERRGYDALARQYGNMHTVFERGERELAAFVDAHKWAEARQVIEALGNEALVEHVQWLVLHRVHPFELIIEG